jgi:hypothetical protein
LFIFKPIKMTLGSRESAVLNVMLDVGPDGLMAPETRAQLIIYDYLQYHDFNVEQLDAASDPQEAAKTLETTVQFFTGREGQGPGTPTRLLQLPPELRNPKPAPGNGILAVADLALRRVTTPAEINSARRVAGPGELWYVNQIIGNTVQTPNDIVFPIGIRMLTKLDEKKVFGQGAVKKDIIGVFGFAKADLPNLEPKRLLAVRLVSTRPQGQFQDGTIIHSSFNRLEHVPQRPASSFRDRAIWVDIAAAQATLKKPGRPSEGAVPVSPSSRRADRDLTGMYELSVQSANVDPDADEYVAPAALFLSQSGQSLVGWYLPYDTIGLGQRFTGAAAPLVPLTTRACLLTLKSDKFPLRAPMYWCADTAADNAVRIDPDRLLATKEFSDARADVMLMNGKLEVANISPASFSVKLTFREKLPTSDVPGEGEVKTGDAPRVAVFKRVRTGAKMPWTILNDVRGDAFVSQEKLDALVRVSVEPLPTGFRRAVGRLLAGQPMRAQITLFAANRGNPTIVGGIFRSVNDQIAAVTNFFPNPAYRDEARNCVQTQIKLVEVTDDAGTKRTLEEWLADIASTHLALQKDIEDRRREQNKLPPMTGEELTDFKESVGRNAPELRDLGLLGGEEFEYDFDFTSQSVGGRLFLGLQVGGFQCRITRRSASGRGDYSLSFVGVFGALSHGLGASLQVGKGDGSPVSCTIKSFQRIDAGDWSSLPFADFTVGAVGGPKGGLENPFFDATGVVFSSTLFTITVKGAANNRPIKLSTVVEDFFEYRIDPAQAADFRERLKKGKVLDVAAELYSLTEGIGWFILSNQIPSAPPPTPDIPVIPEQENPFSQTVNAKLMGFAQGSSVVGERETLALERRLAVYRYLLERPCSYRCVGFASPEFREPRGQGGASQANQSLSEDRANAIDTLLEACLGEPGGGVIPQGAERLLPFGDGKSSSLRPLEANGGGLLDPSAPGVDKERVAREADREYPKWRRVDVVVNATLVARVFGK